MKESLKLHSIEIEDPTSMKEVIKQDMVVKKLPILWFQSIIVAILIGIFSLLQMYYTQFDLAITFLLFSGQFVGYFTYYAFIIIKGKNFSG